MFIGRIHHLHTLRHEQHTLNITVLQLAACICWLPLQDIMFYNSIIGYINTASSHFLLYLLQQSFPPSSRIRENRIKSTALVIYPKAYPHVSKICGLGVNNFSSFLLYACHLAIFGANIIYLAHNNLKSWSDILNDDPI